MKAANRLKRFVKTLIKPTKPPEMWTNKKDGYAKYSIGDWTYGFPIVRDWVQNTTLTIGKYCSIADGVHILLGGEHRTDWVTTYPFAELLHPHPSARPLSVSKGNVTIGHDVWIGLGAIVLSGITIGSGAVVGAGSVVTKSVKPYSIVCGNPARHIRYRIDERFIPEMLKIAWWNWPHDKVLEVAPLLLSNKIEKFVQTYQSYQPHGAS
jgi:acetyltransferase-like isoleucine patch superfamily enzyme